MPLLPTNSNLRVLILRLGAMGDILHALPAITALRQAHPDWFLGWAIEPHWRELISASSKTSDSGRSAAQPLVDQIHRIPAKQWGRKPFQAETLRQIGAVRKELRSFRYDIAVDLQGAFRSALFGRWSRAPKLIGEESPREFAARFLFHQRVETRGALVIEQDVEVASAIAGDHLAPVPPCLPFEEEAEAWADDIISHSRGPVVLLNAGAGWGAKRWPAERYGIVARQLAMEGCQIFLNAGPGEAHLVTSVQEASKGSATVIEAGLGRLIALTRRTSLMIAGDTGPLHLACALGKPVVGIFGPTDPARNGPYGCDFRVLRHPESRRDHTRRTEPEAGLLTITPEAVLAEARQLLGRVPTA
jgi:heptosyltransferase-1